MALWGGRFTQAADSRFKSFNDSLRLIIDWLSKICWINRLVKSLGLRQCLERAGATTVRAGVKSPIAIGSARSGANLSL